MFLLHPLECWFSSMLRGIVLLEGQPPSQSEISGRLKQNFPLFSTIHHSFNSDQLPSPCRWKNIPTAWCCGWCSRGDGRCWVCARHSIVLDGQKAKFSLIWSEYLLPYVWGVSHMPFGEHQTRLLIFFLKQWLFFWTLFRKAQLCGVYGLKWSYGQVLQCPLWSFAAPSGLSLVSLLPLWLMAFLPGLSFSGQPSLGRFVVVSYSFRWMFKVLDIFL